MKKELNAGDKVVCEHCLAVQEGPVEFLAPYGFKGDTVTTPCWPCGKPYILENLDDDMSRFLLSFPD